jgi:hypothetical protein
MGTNFTRDPLGRRWPVEDLVAATRMPMQALAQQAGYTRRSGHRWSVQGWVDDVVADQLACAAGWPPALVWASWTSGAVAEPVAAPRRLVGAS